MAETNFLIFNEENNPDRTYNDSEYKNATQRLTGVIPGMALSRQHNKMYFQWSAMCKAIADFLVTSGYNCMDNNVEGITEGLTKTVTAMIKKDLSTHNTDNEAHKTLFDKKLDTTGGTLTGDLNASGYNITATKFIGNLQGKADNATNADLASKATTAENANNAANATHATSAANADLATKATQDSQGQTINTTYVKGITASNATLTLTKGNGTTSTVTVNNVSNASVANKLGTSMIGSSTKTIYLNNGTPNAVNVDLSTLAPKASPAFSGSPTTPTPTASDNSTKIPNTSWVQTWVKSFINNLSGNLQVNWSGNSFTVPALGITGLMQQNGYINLGKLFGGFKVQWGTNTCNSSNYAYFTLPISFTKFGVITATDIFNVELGYTQSLIGISLRDLSHAKARGRGIKDTGSILINSNPTFNWISLGA